MYKSSPGIEKARLELEKLKQHEQELEARLGLALKNDDTEENDNTNTKHRNSSLPIYNDKSKKSHIKYNGSSSCSNGYDELAQAIYLKSNVNFKDFHSEKEEDSENDEMQKVDTVNNDDQLLINFNDNDDGDATYHDEEEEEDDAELMQYFPNENVRLQQNDVSEEIIYEESENDNEDFYGEDIREETLEEFEELQLSDTSMEITLNNKMEEYPHTVPFYYEREFDKSFEEFEEQNESESETNSPSDHRHKIQQDIEEYKKREHELRFERGSLENLDEHESTEESDEDLPKMPEDIRQMILKEIEAEKMRELELQAKYRKDGLDLSDHHDEFEKTQLTDNMDPRDLIALEMQESEQREKELKISRGAALTENSEEDEEYSPRYTNAADFANPRERIEHEMRLQQEREVEINHIHRSLSNENLLVLDDAGFEENVEYKKLELDTRSKILQEIEEIQLRENRLRNETIVSDQYDHCDYDIIEYENISDETSDVREKINLEISELQRREDELTKQYSYSLGNLAVDKEEKYEQKQLEILDENLTVPDTMEPRSLEDTDKQLFGSRDDLVAFFGTNSDTPREKNKPSKKTTSNVNRIKIPKAFTTSQNQTDQEKSSYYNNVRKAPINTEHSRTPKTRNMKKHKTKTMRSKLNNHEMNREKVKAHAQSGMQKNSEPASDKYSTKRLQNHMKQNKLQGQLQPQIQQTTEQPHKRDTVESNGLYFHDELKPMKTSKKKLVLRKKSLPRKGLISQDVKKEERKNTKRPEEKRKKQGAAPQRLDIHPIAAQWERKGEEERQRKLEMELELHRKKEERLRCLAEKAEHERHLRLLEEEAQRERQKKERERQIQKSKQQGLSELWSSKKPIVTIEDNSDQDDQDILQHTASKRPVKTRELKQMTEKPAQMQSPLAISKTIMKWEKRIAKRSQSNQ